METINGKKQKNYMYQPHINVSQETKDKVKAFQKKKRLATLGDAVSLLVKNK